MWKGQSAFEMLLGPHLLLGPHDKGTDPLVAAACHSQLPTVVYLFTQSMSSLLFPESAAWRAIAPTPYVSSVHSGFTLEKVKLVMSK